MIDFSLTEEQKMLQETARKFAINEIRPVAIELDRSHDPNKSFPLELIKKGLQLGFGNTLVPAKFGGYGVTLIDYAIVAEELAW